MLIFNPKRMFDLRGIERASGFMVRHGFTYPTANRLLKTQSPNVRVSDIEQLCVALNCTPNDLFEWQPDKQTVLPENHSLAALHKSGEPHKNLQQIVKDIPADKLELLENLLDELKK